MAKAKLLGATALAEALGVSRYTVYQYLREGKISREKAGGFHLEHVKIQLAQNLGSKHGGPPKRGAKSEAPPKLKGKRAKVEVAGDDANAPEGSKADLEKKFLAERIEAKRRANEQAAGKLLEVEEAGKAWGEMVTTARNKALMLPSELAPKLALETDTVVCEEILRAGVYAMLSELASYQPQYAPHA